MPSSFSLPSLSKAAVLVALSIGLTLHAQTNKKTTPAPAPAKPAPAKPATTPAKPGATGSTTTAAHGPTTTTSGARTTTTTAGAAGHTTTTAGAPGRTTTTAGAAGHPAAAAPGRAGAGASHAPLAEHGPMAHPGPVGGHEVRTANGGAVRYRPNGKPADFHDARRGMDIHHNLGGGRRVLVERPDHSRLMYERGRPGYIGHPYAYRGHDFERRAYYYHGHAYNRFYLGYGYHGLHLGIYAPLRYYPVGFYGWAYHPWARPYAYEWGWAAHPWYGYYGGYFTPYPTYASPALWLTDYMISQSLAAQYEASVAAGPPPPMGVVAPMNPEVKQMVADEVQRQITLENSEAALNAQGLPPDPASSSIGRQLSDGQPHAFVAGGEVDVVDAGGQECAVTEGDVLQLTSPPPPDATAAQLMVVASKGGADCRRMDVVSVPLEDLQEMQNHMRQTVDDGLADLQAKQGKGGLPTAPPSALAAPVDASFAQGAPPPDAGGEAELTAQGKQADESEQELASAAIPDGATPAPVERPADAAPASVNIAPGQSPDDVKAALGQPKRVVNLGPKTIYFYDGMKITFKGGKVTDIE